MTEIAARINRDGAALFGSHTDAENRGCGVWGIPLPKSCNWEQVCKLAQKSLLKEDYVGKMKAFMNNARKDTYLSHSIQTTCQRLMQPSSHSGASAEYQIDSYRGHDSEIAKKLAEAFGIADSVATEVTQTMRLSQAAWWECMLMSLLTDPDLQSDDNKVKRQDKVDKTFKKMQATEKALGSLNKLMHPLITKEAARCVFSN
eukprot:6490789-Amphidinium_carterae.1